MSANYNPRDQKVYLTAGGSLFNYDIDRNKLVQLSTARQDGYAYTGILDPLNQKLLLMGVPTGGTVGHVLAWDIGANATYQRQVLETTGGEAIVNGYYPGLAFDSKRGQVVAWNGGDSVYALSLTTRSWKQFTFPGGPGDVLARGTMKRWSYSCADDAFVLVSAMNKDAFAFRLPEP